jgi:hypothetical protein
MIAPKPRELSHIEAASVPVVAVTAWQMLFDREFCRIRRVRHTPCRGKNAAYLVNTAAGAESGERGTEALFGALIGGAAAWSLAARAATGEPGGLWKEYAAILRSSFCVSSCSTSAARRLGRGVATTSYSALRLFPMAQSQAALLGLRTARFLEGETWRDRITDLDRMIPILGLS